MKKVVVSGLATKNETFYLDDKGRPEEAQITAVPLTKEKDERSLSDHGK